MTLKTFVKIGNITNLSDARYCAGMGVDVLGFPLHRTEERPDMLENFNNIRAWVAGVRFAGEFGQLAADGIIKILEMFAVDIIETCRVDVLPRVSKLGKEVFLKQDISSLSPVVLLERLSILPSLSGVILEGTGDNDIWDTFLNGYKGPVKLLKGFGLTTYDNLSKFQGISLMGSEEEKTGFKEYGELMDILEALEVDD